MPCERGSLSFQRLSSSCLITHSWNYHTLSSDLPTLCAFRHAAKYSGIGTSCVNARSARWLDYSCSATSLLAIRNWVLFAMIVMISLVGSHLFHAINAHQPKCWMRNQYSNICSSAILRANRAPGSANSKFGCVRNVGSTPTESLVPNKWGKSATATNSDQGCHKRHCTDNDRHTQPPLRENITQLRKTGHLYHQQQGKSSTAPKAPQKEPCYLLQRRTSYWLPLPRGQEWVRLRHNAVVRPLRAIRGRTLASHTKPLPHPCTRGPPPCSCTDIVMRSGRRRAVHAGHASGLASAYGPDLTKW